MIFVGIVIAAVALGIAGPDFFAAACACVVLLVLAGVIK